MKDEGYVCKECGKKAVMVNGKILRSCEHKSTVIATMSGTTYGLGGIKNNAQKR